MSNNRRRHRVEIGKVAFARGENQSFGGTLEDISSTGANIIFGSKLPEGQVPFERGDAIEVVVDKMSTLTAWVVRSNNTSVAVEFAHDNEGEKRLVAEIMESM